jgi:hypothetical protein
LLPRYSVAKTQDDLKSVYFDSDPTQIVSYWSLSSSGRHI